MKFFFSIILKKVATLVAVIIFAITNRYKSLGKSKIDLILEDNLNKETFETFGEIFNKHLLYRDTSSIREYAIKEALSNDTNKKYSYLEFGIWEGKSANFFSKHVKKLYAFDSFEGLCEDWSGSSAPKFAMSLNKKIPKLNSNIETVVGWVEDTLDEFLKKHNPKINFVHLDMDTFSPTQYTLEKIKPYLVKDAIIIFDELYNYLGWKDGEYKALKEIFKDDEYQYKAFNINAQQAVIQIK